MQYPDEDMHRSMRVTSQASPQRVASATHSRQQAARFHAAVEQAARHGKAPAHGHEVRSAAANGRNSSERARRMDTSSMNTSHLPLTIEPSLQPETPAPGSAASVVGEPGTSDPPDAVALNRHQLNVLRHDGQARSAMGLGSQGRLSLRPPTKQGLLSLWPQDDDKAATASGLAGWASTAAGPSGRLFSAGPAHERDLGRKLTEADYQRVAREVTQCIERFDKLETGTLKVCIRFRPEHLPDTGAVISRQGPRLLVEFFSANEQVYQGLLQRAQDIEQVIRRVSSGSFLELTVTRVARSQLDEMFRDAK